MSSNTSLHFLVYSDWLKVQPTNNQSPYFCNINEAENQVTTTNIHYFKTLQNYFEIFNLQQTSKHEPW